VKVKRAIRVLGNVGDRETEPCVFPLFTFAIRVVEGTVESETRLFNPGCQKVVMDKDACRDRTRFEVFWRLAPHPGSGGRLLGGDGERMRGEGRKEGCKRACVARGSYLMGSEHNGISRLPLYNAEVYDKRQGRRVRQ
jgi:hypothetical protein